jgi:hypothetical protein
VNALALLLLMAGTDPVQVPVAGRPVDFSGAVGGPFEVKYEVNTNRAKPGEQFMISILITGSGDFSQFKPPDLQVFPQLRNDLIVDRVDILPQTSTAGIATEYQVRAKTNSAIVLPRWKFVYFNPVVRDWQTTYADSASFNIGSRLKKRGELVDNSPAHQQWSLSLNREIQRPRGEFRVHIDAMLDRFQEYLPTISPGGIGSEAAIWCLPVVLCGLIVAGFGTRRANHMSTASQCAIDELRNCSNGDAIRVREIVLGVLIKDARLPTDCNTVPEITDHLGHRPSLTSLLDECDRQRFGNRTIDDRDLVSLARQGIAQWKPPPSSNGST